MKLPAALLGLALGGAASGMPAQAPASSPSPGLELCSLLVRCGVTAPPAGCTEALSRGVPGVTYDAARCAEGRRLFEQGLSPADLLGQRVYRLLGRRYRVVYAIAGEAPISQTRFRYLLDDLPLAAKLLARLQGKAYSAEYLDKPARRRFRGGRPGFLSGEAELIAEGPGDRTYFGLGTSQVGLWSLRGLALLELEFAPVVKGHQLAYRIRVVASPVNAFYDVLMHLGVFRGLVEGRLREVIGDITQAMAKLEGGQTSILVRPDWTEEERAKLRALLQLP